MSSENITFNHLVETVYSLSLEDRLELKTLLEHSIIESRRNEIAENFEKAKEEERENQLRFSSNINELKTML